jgi:hypothetical protein
MSQGTKAVLDDLKHSGEFTKIENTAIVYVLRGWFGSLSAIPGALEAGDDAWAFTTLQEHFDSKLNPDPTKRTPEQVRILGELQKKAKETQDRVDEILGAKSDEDERINKLVDAFVEQLVKNSPERAIPAT